MGGVEEVAAVGEDAVVATPDAAVVVASAIIFSRAPADSVTSARNRTKLGLAAAAVVEVVARAPPMVMEKDVVAVEDAVVEKEVVAVGKVAAVDAVEKDAVDAVAVGKVAGAAAVVVPAT